MRPSPICATALVFTSLLTAHSALAQDSSGTRFSNSMFGGKHLISLGGAEQDADATIGASVNDAPLVELTLDELGIDDSDSTFFLEYRYRFSEKWSVLAATYQFSGTGGRTAQRDFTYNGVDFTAGTEFNASLEVDAYFVDLMYQVYESDNIEVKLGAGLHALDLGADISATVTIDDAEAGLRTAGSTLLAPVPNFRASGTWLLGDNFGLRFVGGWLSADIDDYEGSFSYAHLRAFYTFNQKLGVSVGYQVTDVDVTQNRRFTEIGYEVDLQGPTLTFSYRF